jgi:hypothetical protein
VGNPAEETYCYPNKLNSMTGTRFVNWLFLPNLIGSYVANRRPAAYHSLSR